MSMTQCAFCKSTLSAGARFCGRCGTVVAENDQDNEQQPPFDFGRGFGSTIGSPTEFDLSGSTEPDSLFGSTRGEPIGFLPDLRESFDTEGSTIAGPTNSGVRFLPTLHEPLEPEREIGSTIADLADTGAGFLPLVGESTRLAQGGVPSIQGTPQAGGVPSVPGTPLRFDSAATYDSPHHEQQAFHHEPQHYQPAHHAQSPLHQHHQQQAFHHGQQPPQHYQQLQHQFPQRQVGSATSHQPSGGARASQHAQRGCRPSCLTTAITGTVIITMLVTIVLFFPGLRNALLSPFGHSQLPAMLNLNGNIVPGGALSIHGSNFTPGGTVSLTLDGQPAIIASAGSPVARQASPATQTETSFLLGVYQATIAPSSGTMIAVKDDGTFDITIKTDPNWLVGSSHTLIATEESSKQSVKLTLTIPQKPALASCSKSTTTTTLTLGPVTEGQQQTVTAPFRLCTTGSGIVNWTASWDQQQAAWLQLTSSGKIPAPLMQQLQVSASAAGLKAGTYQATVNFSSSGSNLKLVLQVTLMVRPAQATTCVNSNTQALSFTATQGQGNSTPQTVTLTNCGDPGSWSVSTRTDDGAHWLNAGPTAGDLQAQATQDVSITVASTTLGAGTYTGQVTFKLGSSTAAINITLTVQPPAQVSCITASSQALSFTATQGQGDPAPQTTTIGNCGSSGDWSISTGTVDGANWLSVTPTHGTLTANAAQDVSIGVTSADLQLGTYAGRVTFKLRSSTMTVNVFLTVQQMRPQPCLHVNTASLAFTSTQGQGNPDPQMLALANCGPAGDWSAIIANDSSWLNLNLGKGRLNTGATQDVLVTVSTAHLNQGTYRDRVIFTLGSRSVLVDVILTVQSPPQCIQVSTQSLRFAATQGQADPAPQTLTLTNCGTSGNWSAASANNASWLSVKPGRGRLNAGAMQDVSVSVSTTGLAPKTYHDVITFTLGSRSVKVDVTLTVSPATPVPQGGPAQCIQASTPSLSFTATQGQADLMPQTVTLTNCGPSGNWSASSANKSSWLSLNPGRGTLNAGVTQGVSVSVAPGNLHPNTYSDQLIFTLGSSTVKVDVTLTVSAPVLPPSTTLPASPTPTQPPPASCIKASAQSLSFAATHGQGAPAAQMLTISNCADAGTWSASVSTDDGASWLSVSSKGGPLDAGASQNVGVSVSNALRPGTYMGHITFTLQTSSGVKSVTVGVMFVVS